MWRDKKATKRMLLALLKRYGFVPKCLVTDKLRSSGVVKADVVPSLDHLSYKRLNNRAKKSRLPFRKRERTMQFLQAILKRRSIRLWLIVARYLTGLERAGRRDVGERLPNSSVLRYS